MALVLRAAEVAGPARWRWLLSDGAGPVVADHQVALDTDALEYTAFCDLYEHVRRARTPHDPVGSEARAVERVGSWIGAHVFGETLGGRLRGTVRVQVPAGAEFLLARPLEVAMVDGATLTGRGVTLVYELPGVAPREAKDQVGETLRILALFSMPARTSVLALRRERYELARTVRQIAARSRKAIELRVLQYGVTRERLAEAVEEFPGWDVLHVSGHGDVGALMFERDDGDPDLVYTEDLIELLRPARERLKLAVLSACSSGDLADGADPGAPVGLARGMVEQLGVAVLAMRYPIADGFAVALAGELYPRLLGGGQPIDRAVALAVPRAVGERPSADRPALSAGTPALFGGAAVGLSMAPPPGKVVLDPYAERMAWFPPEPERFVGRSKALIEGSAALAPRSGRPGVLFVGMAGAGKTACALELAHQHRGRFGALAWWQAPTRPDEFNQALTSLAHALETQLGLSMMEAVGSEEALRRFLPRLGALLREEGVLLVLDNLDSLLSADNTWRDPMWTPLMHTLVGHGGLSRVVLTSRVTPSGLDTSGLLTVPTHALSVAESVLLARELPHLGQLLRDEAGPHRAPGSLDRRELARRVLTVAQGHPKLLELADAAAADPVRLASGLAAAEAAGRDAPVSAFFTVGVSDLDGGQFTRVLAAWTSAALADLPAPARTLAELLAHIEDDHRLSWVVDEVWPAFWARRHRGATTPPLDTAVEALRSAAVVATEQDDDTVVYRLHPGVAEAIRAESGAAVGPTVDDAMADLWQALYLGAADEEARGERMSAPIVWVGLSAAPYLLRRGRWAEASTLVEAAATRDVSPEAIQRALSYLRQIMDGDPDPERRPINESLYAWLLARVDPSAGEAKLRATMADARARGQLQAASAIAGDLVELLRDVGDLAAAHDVATEMLALSRAAGLGPWTLAADECAQLAILDEMGRHGEALEQALALLGRVESLPLPSRTGEQVSPWSVREKVLNTAYAAAVNLREWEAALDLNRWLGKSHEQRGAPAHERARLRLNDCTPLLELGRLDEAEAVLVECQRVFEKHDDVELLGAVLVLRADIADERDDMDDAVSLAKAALRYQYARPQIAGLVAGHRRLGDYLVEAGHGREALAHQLAAILLTKATTRPDSNPVVQLADLRAYGRELFPASLDQLTARVEQVAGVRFDIVLASLVPDRDARAELFAEAVTNRPALNDAVMETLLSWDPVPMREAIRRAAEGERGDDLTAGLDEASAEILRAFLEAQSDER